MDFMKRNLFITLLGFCGILFVSASTPGFSMSITKTWTGDTITYSECSGEIVNASKLKLNNWFIEVPFDNKNNKFLGSWGCEVTEETGKLVLKGEVTNAVLKVLTNTTFGFIVSSEGSKFDVEKATLHTQTKIVPNHTEADGSNDDEDMNIGLPKENNRYFPESMEPEELIKASSALTVAEVKDIIFKELNEHWDVISKYLKTDNMLKVQALFLGWASRESTLNAGVETAQEDGFGVNSAHAYGPFQTAVTAFYGCDPTFDQEDDVPELYWYTLTKKNFYDPYISTHMGIRKLIHFVKEAESFDQKGVEVVRCALKGFNSGHANPMEESEKGTGYSDEIGSLAHWYYNSRHFLDNTYTWTGDEKVDRTDPWGWWDTVKPYDNLKLVVHVKNPDDGTTATYATDAYPTPTGTGAKTTTINDIKPTTPSSSDSCWAKDLGYPCCKSTCDVEFTDDSGDWGVENDDWCGIIPSKCKASTTKNSKPTSSATDECWAKALGYPCCKSTCVVETEDDDGKWGAENGNWCGIIPSKCEKKKSEACFSKSMGYDCCKGCVVQTSDADGAWGVENGKWCGIKDSCYN